ncbi:hypothetical protein CC80DRAFT_300257 [Byssothecium circinans]|uniref:Uncharacterized protein n=1 Tax=Byssothecium circinans TaxID=147558 RepID=A0A6A5T8X2_9PLEO|nr:hypothetical protein CC80DRAFT_315022 [Byssothecium circinans]KAF1948604.1 hypothetical protein CC80DRAFT_300257 [Byssothecium circinans]
MRCQINKTKQRTAPHNLLAKPNCRTLSPPFHQGYLPQLQAWYFSLSCDNTNDEKRSSYERKRHGTTRQDKTRHKTKRNVTYTGAFSPSPRMINDQKRTEIKEGRTIHTMPSPKHCLDIITYYHLNVSLLPVRVQG